MSYSTGIKFGMHFQAKRCSICVILRIIPRESYRFSAAGNVDGKLTMVLVFNAGDEEYLRKDSKIPDDDDTFRDAVHYCMEAGVYA